MASDARVIACIVLNWNGGLDTERCIRSLMDSKGTNPDIVVVDNGSSDGSPERLMELFPQVSMLCQSANLGVAKAFNIGVEWALVRGHEFIFFLNNDAILQEDCLAILEEVLMREGSVSVVSPRILDGSVPGKLWFDGGRRNVFGDFVHVGMGHSTSGEEQIRQTDFASGCAMLVRSDAFEEVGVFDEKYFAYSEDAEWCSRVKRKGRQVAHAPRALATHFPSSATIRNKGKWFRDYYVTRNKLLFVSGELRGMRWMIFLIYYAIMYVVMPSLFFLLAGQFQRIVAVWNGAADFVKGRFGPRYS